MFRFRVLAFAAIFRPSALLIAENLCLRQQLLVLQRRHPRPRLSNADRRFWILASRWFGGWRDLLLIVKRSHKNTARNSRWRLAVNRTISALGGNAHSFHATLVTSTLLLRAVLPAEWLLGRAVKRWIVNDTGFSQAGRALGRCGTAILRRVR